MPRGSLTLAADEVGSGSTQTSPSKQPLTQRLIFHLPLRQAEGFLTSLFRLMGLDLPSPDHTTLSRRGQHLNVTLRHLPQEKQLHLMIDSTGLSMFGEGEWAAKHGGHGKRGLRKLHIGVNRSGVIVAQALTDATTDDALTGITLMGAVDGNVASVTADPAYDTIAFYDAATEHGPAYCMSLRDVEDLLAEHKRTPSAAPSRRLVAALPNRGAPGMGGVSPVFTGRGRNRGGMQ